jgi:hypothetical protein
MSVVLNAAIKKSLSEKGQLDVGQVQLLNMDMVKIAAGAGWPAMRKKIFEASAGFIEKRIRKDDMLIPCEEGFLLIFADATEEEANHRMERLGVQMREFFLGTPVLSSLGLKCEAKSVTTEEFVELAGGLSKEPEKKLVPMPEHEVFKAGFRPFWDSQKSVIGGNLCEPLVEAEDRDRLARDLVGARLIRNSQAELDVFTAKTAIAALRQLGQDKALAPIRFTVHFETIFAADARSAYLSVLGVVPKPMRRYFQVVLDCPPLEKKETRIILRELREFGVSIVLQPELADPDLARFEDCGLAILAVDAPRPDERDAMEGMLDRHKGQLARFVEAAKRQRAWTHVDAARDVKTVKDAAGCGARFIAGPAIGDHVERPVPGKPFSLIDLAQHRKAA